MEIPFLKSRLKKAIERGLVSGKLEEELEDLGEITVKSRGDGEAICWGLEQLENRDHKFTRELAYRLAGLFQNVEGGDCAACDVLRERGIPELLKIYDRINGSREDEVGDTLLRFLNIFGMYGTTEGRVMSVEEARQPVARE